MNKISVYAFTLIIVCTVKSYPFSIDNEFTFTTNFGHVIHDYNQPPENPFDWQMGFGYSAIFKKYYMKVDGEILYSLSEMESRKTTTIVDRKWDRNNQKYQSIYGETDYQSILISGNIVPCFTFHNFYAGLGLCFQYRQVKFPNLDSNNVSGLNIDTYIISGYSWKYFQSGIYVDGFVNRVGVFFRVNLLTLKKRLQSKSLE